MGSSDSGRWENYSIVGKQYITILFCNNFEIFTFGWKFHMLGYWMTVSLLYSVLLHTGLLRNGLLDSAG
jgi:hypothetical protein